jgi:hypothetical protein
MSAIVVVQRTDSVGVDALAREAGLHPEVVRHLLRMGLLERTGGTAAAPRFARDAAAQLARAARLRRDLGLNYAGAVLACELLARISELEERLSRYEP